MIRLLSPILPCLLLVLGLAQPLLAAPRVVVSLKPIHSLAAALMQGAGTPELLVRSGASPHNYALRPTEARALSDAGLIVWVGEGLETFLVKPLATLGNQARVLKLAAALEGKLLKNRPAGKWGEEGHAHDHGHQGQGADLHLWLDPALAADISKAVENALIETDPANAALYRTNGEKLRLKLGLLDQELAATLSQVQKEPYVVFHDAYQYLEKRYGLTAVAAITLSPERSPGLKRLRQIRAAIAEHQARCVFAEPQFEPRLIRTLVDGLPLRSGVLDPLGSAVPEGPEAYFTLMRDLAGALVQGLKPQAKTEK